MQSPTSSLQLPASSLLGVQHCPCPQPCSVIARRRQSKAQAQILPTRYPTLLTPCARSRAFGVGAGVGVCGTSQCPTSNFCLECLDVRKYTSCILHVYFVGNVGVIGMYGRAVLNCRSLSASTPLAGAAPWIGCQLAWAWNAGFASWAFSTVRRKCTSRPRNVNFPHQPSNETSILCMGSGSKAFDLGESALFLLR